MLFESVQASRVQCSRESDAEIVAGEVLKRAADGERVRIARSAESAILPNRHLMTLRRGFWAFDPRLGAICLSLTLSLDSPEGP